jgi:hypothetical protein
MFAAKRTCELTHCAPLLPTLFITPAKTLLHPT